jgi:hypothetical protein
LFHPNMDVEETVNIPAKKTTMPIIMLNMPDIRPMTNADVLPLLYIINPPDIVSDMISHYSMAN